ncbi:MAG: DUF4124 domain-containing protein [Gammaproteobacteria bacterium]
MRRVFAPRVAALVQTCLMVCLLAACCAAAHAGDIYKWTDPQGRVHYGDKQAAEQPGGGSAIPVQLRPEPPADPETAGRRARQEKLLRSMQEDDAVKARREHQAQAKAAERQARCTRARKRLQHYRSSRYLYEKGDDGQRRILTDAERAAAEKRLQTAIESHCD